MKSIDKKVYWDLCPIFGFGYISQTITDNDDEKIIVNNVLIGFLVIGIIKSYKKLSQYANKEINQNFYGTFKINGNHNPTVITTEKSERAEPGVIYAPYVTREIKTIIVDENGIREVWLISKWERFKLFLYKLFFKPVPFKDIKLRHK